MRHLSVLAGLVLGLAAGGVAVAEQVTARNGKTYDIPGMEGWQNYRYLGSELSIDQAAAEYFATGEGMRVVDFEGAANLFHPDLADAQGNPVVTDLTAINWKGQTIGAMCLATHYELNVCANYSAHGTAVLGLLVAQKNGYGMTGLAPDAEAFIASGQMRPPSGDVPDEDGLRLALKKLREGDVLLIEAQGEFNETERKLFEKAFGDVFQKGQGGPFDLDDKRYELLKAAAERGAVIVFGAGNSGISLDFIPRYLLREDYGAMVVGAREAIPLEEGGAVVKTAVSNFGVRVTLNSRGATVATTGAATLHGGGKATFFPEGETYVIPALREGPDGKEYGFYGGDEVALWNELKQEPPYYTLHFGGTSSASALVAGLATAFQSYYKSTYGNCLTSGQMRQHFIDTAGLVDAKGQIGASPNLLRAIEALRGGPPKPQLVSILTGGWSTTLGARSNSDTAKGLTVVRIPREGATGCDTRGNYVRAVTQHLDLSTAIWPEGSSAKLTIEGAERLALAPETASHYGLKKVDGVFLSVDGREWFPLAPWAEIAPREGALGGKVITIDLPAVIEWLSKNRPKEWFSGFTTARLKVQSFGDTRESFALVEKITIDGL